MRTGICYLILRQTYFKAFMRTDKSSYMMLRLVRLSVIADPISREPFRILANQLARRIHVLGACPPNSRDKHALSV